MKKYKPSQVKNPSRITISKPRLNDYKLCLNYCSRRIALAVKQKYLSPFVRIKPWIMGDPQKHILCIKWQNVSKRLLYYPRSEDKECRSVNYALSHIQLFVALWIGGCQAPLPMEFSRQEYWSGVPFPTPGELPDPGIEPVSLSSPAFQILCLWAIGEAEKRCHLEQQQQNNFRQE